jgi:hypothetical protein
MPKEEKELTPEEERKQWIAEQKKLGGRAKRKTKNGWSTYLPSTRLAGSTRRTS